MKAYYTVKEIADEMAVSEQSVRNWIRSGQIIAIQPVTSGVMRIPVPAFDAFKRKQGILPPIPRSTGSAHVETFGDLADFYRRAIEPRLRELDLSVDEVLVRAAGDRVFASSHRRLLGDLARYVNWVAEGVGDRKA